MKKRKVTIHTCLFYWATLFILLYTLQIFCILCAILCYFLNVKKIIVRTDLCIVEANIQTVFCRWNYGTFQLPDPINFAEGFLSNFFPISEEVKENLVRLYMKIVISSLHHNPEYLITLLWCNFSLCSLIFLCRNVITYQIVATFMPLEHRFLGLSFLPNGSLSVLSNSGHGGFFANHYGQRPWRFMVKMMGFKWQFFFCLLPLAIDNTV